MKQIYLLLSLVILISGCVQNVQQGEKMNLTGKSVLMIIAHENFRDEEFEEPYKILTNANADVTIASSSTTNAKGMLGKIVKPDKTLYDINIEDYDAVIFVGGSGAMQYFNDSTALKIAKQSYEQKKIVAAICIAPVILANSGILKEKRATVWDGEFINKLRNGGAIYTGKDVEIDGNIITANGPKSAKKFGETIANILSK